MSTDDIVSALGLEWDEDSDVIIKRVLSAVSKYNNSMRKYGELIDKWNDKLPALSEKENKISEFNKKMGAKKDELDGRIDKYRRINNALDEKVKRMLKLKSDEVEIRQNYLSAFMSAKKWENIWKSTMEYDNNSKSIEINTRELIRSKISSQLLLELLK